MALVLRSEQGNRNAYKSLIAAEYCGVEVEHVKEFQTGVSDKTHLFLNTRVFLDKNRIGGVPVLETPDGLIVESNAMARYVAKFKGDDTLCGSSPYEFIQIEQWMTYTTREIEEVLIRWVYTRIGVYPYNAQVEHILIDRMKKGLRTLNKHLARNNNYLVGNHITLADIVMACDLYWGFTHVMAKSFTSGFPRVEQYFWNLVGQPNFKKFLGEVKQAEPLPVLLPPRKLFVRPEVIEAVKKRRAYQMEAQKGEGVSNTRMLELVREYAIELQKEKMMEANNQMMEAQKEEGVNNQMMEAQKEGVNNQMMEAQKEEGLDQMIEAHEKLTIQEGVVA